MHVCGNRSTRTVWGPQNVWLQGQKHQRLLSKVLRQVECQRLCVSRNRGTSICVKTPTPRGCVPETVCQGDDWHGVSHYGRDNPDVVRETVCQGDDWHSTPNGTSSCSLVVRETVC